MAEELVHFVTADSIHHSVAAALERHWQQLRKLLPGAEIEHVGSTAVPGLLTKGDIDIQVRVPQNAFAQSEQILSAYYPRNENSVRTSDFASFKNAAATPPLGIQLTAAGGQFDVFSKLRDLLRDHPYLIEDFNALKQRHEGRPMEEYRAAKSQWIEALLSNRAEMLK